jgi:undecaprenyl-diphosphatase
LDGAFSESVKWAELGAGFVAAFLTGLFACTLMIAIVKRSKLTYFAIYCFIVGTLAISWKLFF